MGNLCVGHAIYSKHITEYYISVQYSVRDYSGLVIVGRLVIFYYSEQREKYNSLHLLLHIKYLIGLPRGVEDALQHVYLVSATYTVRYYQ